MQPQNETYDVQIFQLTPNFDIERDYTLESDCMSPIMIPKLATESSHENARKLLTKDVRSMD